MLNICRNDQRKQKIKKDKKAALVVESNLNSQNTYLSFVMIRLMKSVVYVADYAL